MAARVRYVALFLIQLLVFGSGEDVVGTRWAVLIAGSKGFQNYRHQANVCHAYQILKKGGLKDENIIVFMYDDIANNTENPRPGVIINHPNGSDVYAGVPKDYTGEDVNAHNFLAVLLGDKSNLTGRGSGKVVNSGPDDHVFVYYTDHGGPGVLGMPAGDRLYAKDLVQALEKKHAAAAGGGPAAYKSLALYVEACDSGSIFEGLLREDMNVYTMTSAGADELGWAAYCPGGGLGQAPPPEFHTCLGDMFSVAWMEDSDAHDLRNETLTRQYEVVRDNTLPHGAYGKGSHVMRYGDLAQSNQSLYSFIGTNPANDNAADESSFVAGGGSRVDQRAADLVYFWRKYRNAGDGAARREARERLLQVMARRSQLDSSVDLIGGLLFGAYHGPKVLSAVRPRGQPLVDDWDCLKSLARTYEGHCGPLGQYGMKHMRAFANICNAGVAAEDMARVAARACSNNVHSDTQH